MTIATIGPAASLPCRMPPEPVLPLTVQQYDQMVQAGILDSGAPTELLAGWLVEKPTEDPYHNATVRSVYDAMTRLVGRDGHVRMGARVTTDDSELEPDVLVVRSGRRNRAACRPAASEVGLLIEVANASLVRDRGWKKRIYASARIPVYWIVNSADRQMEVFTSPSGPIAAPDYATREVYRPGDSVPVWLDGIRLCRIGLFGLLPYVETEFLAELEEELKRALLDGMEPEDRLRGLSPEERLRGLRAEELDRVRELLERK